MVFKIHKAVNTWRVNLSFMIHGEERVACLHVEAWICDLSWKASSAVKVTQAKICHLIDLESCFTREPNLSGV